MSKDEYISKVIQAMEKASGHTFDYETRRDASAWERTIVADHLLAEGYTTIEIGKALNRDHSTVTFMKGRMAKLRKYRNMYPIETKLYNKFNAIVYDKI